jgi:hypothetical protein
MGKKRKTVGRSFRIDEEWLNVLNEEAEKQGVSVNSVLNRLLQQYAYLRFMLRYGAITITRKGFVGILGCCPDDELRENGINAGSTIVKDLMLTMGVTPNYGFVLSLVKTLLSDFAGWFECDHHIKRDKEILHLRHDLGMKWSIYVSGVATGTFNSILNKEVGIEFSDSSVTITIEKQNTTT